MLVSYTGQHRDAHRELIISNLCNKVSSIISLPDTIEVELQKLEDGIWGGTHLHWKFKNRIAINCSLALTEIPLVLVHELIHLYQLHSGILVVDRGGRVYWQGIAYNISNLSYAEYQKLPWEVDVNYRLKKVLELATNT